MEATVVCDFAPMLSTMTPRRASDVSGACYGLFGLEVRSDCALPFEHLSCHSEEAHSRVELHRRPERHGAGADDLGAWTDQGGRMRYGGWWFECSLEEGAVYYARDGEAEHRLPLFHVVERLMLPLHATIVRPHAIGLHAGGAILEDEAWLFVAPTGTGKSSTIYELIRRFGARALSDEMAVVDVEAGTASVGAPALRLDRRANTVPEAVEEGPIHPESDKRWFRLDSDYLARRSRPLAGIVRLEADSALAAGAFEWRRLEGSEALTLLLDQTFDVASSPPDWRRRRFRRAGRLTRSIPVHHVRYARSASGEPTHVESLVEALDSLR